MMLGKTFAAVVALSGLSLGMAEDFQVYSPSAGMSVLADSTFTVKWTGYYEQSRVEIDLYYCGPDCGKDECGDWVTTLCPYGESGCPDNKGDYDVTMPMPMAGTGTGAVYKVGVKDVKDEGNRSCSDGFKILLDESEMGEGKKGWAPGMTVTSPKEGDMAHAGETYTVLFDYYDKVGNREGRFNIDLYESDGKGTCGGTFVTSVCDKPEIGCRDTMGDYNIEIPMVPQGLYTIMVSPFDDDSTYDCSGEFLIVSDIEYDMSYSYSWE